MPRKRWTAKTETTPDLQKFREKRKWQIALRRYVLDKNLSASYAPYFGLDIENLRKWFEIQFESDVGWEDFGKKWQFDHVIPVAFFDFSIESELKTCWNFTNLRINQSLKNIDRGIGFDVLTTREYFQELYKKTLYTPCLSLLKKIDTIKTSEILKSEKQQQFINENRPYLDMIENYSAFEFELLNSGREITAVKKEIDFFRKMGK